jgi:hypothetical protein
VVVWALLLAMNDEVTRLLHHQYGVRWLRIDDAINNVEHYTNSAPVPLWNHLLLFKRSAIEENAI